MRGGIYISESLGEGVIQKNIFSKIYYIKYSGKTSESKYLTCFSKGLDCVHVFVCVCICLGEGSFNEGTFLTKKK